MGASFAAGIATVALWIGGEQLRLVAIIALVFEVIVAIVGVAGVSYAVEWGSTKDELNR